MEDNHIYEDLKKFYNINKLIGKGSFGEVYLVIIFINFIFTIFPKNNISYIKNKILSIKVFYKSKLAFFIKFINIITLTYSLEIFIKSRPFKSIDRFNFIIKILNSFIPFFFILEFDNNI